MRGISIILASQTFVIPRNAYEWSQLPSSLFMLAAAGSGALAALAVARHAGGAEAAAAQARAAALLETLGVPAPAPLVPPPGH